VTEGLVPPGGWETLAAEGGVVLRGAGHGRPLVIFPGMEGDGPSCLHLVLPVWKELATIRERQLVLVDYADEQHPTLAALVDTLIGLLGSLPRAPVSLWGQSFGNLLAASVATADVVPVERIAFVSPFTRLPKPLLAVTPLLSLTPAVLYRVTTPMIGQWLFGPVNGNRDHPFFASLAAMTPRTVVRRAGWLRGRRFVRPFLQMRAPIKVWLGERDRLIDLDDELAFFQAVTRGDGDQLTLVPDSGHVVLPAGSAKVLRHEVSAWFSDQD
jgi:alpha-beta hydrolase superfamily lysophospholipase